MTSEVQHDQYQPYTQTQIAQLKEYIARLDASNKSLWEIPVGADHTWDMHVSPELVILYADGVEDFNPWYEAWSHPPGESPFGPAVAPVLMLPYFQHRLPRLIKDTHEVGGVATGWRTEILEPCPIGRTVRFHGKIARRYIKRGRQTVDREFRIEDAETGQLYTIHTTSAVAKYTPVTEEEARLAAQSDSEVNGTLPWELSEAFAAAANPPSPPVKAVVTKDTPIGYELDGVKKRVTIQIMGSRIWGRVSPLHFDPVVAAQHGLPAPIATGMMSSAYLAETCVNFFGTSMFRKATMEGKFVKSVYPNEVITTRGIVREKTPEANGYRFTVELWTENEAGEKKTVAMVTALVE